MSKHRYEFSAAARLDLLELWNYLAENASVDTADKILADIESSIQTIVVSPGHGHKRPDLTNRNVRFYRVHSHLIVYRPTTKPVQILRILHAARDVKTLLDG